MTKVQDRVLLASLAHPDDESFGPGGTLAYYAHQGVQVHLLCATRGEAGTVSPQFMEIHQDIAALREEELRCAAEHLGLAGVHFLGYRDSGMEGDPSNQHPDALASAPLEEVAAQVTHYLRQLQPQVVITFDPIGGYGHPDHIAIQRATVEAFQAAANPDLYPDEFPPHQPQKLYFSTFPKRILRILVRLMPLFGQDPRKWGKNQDINLLEFTSHDFPIHAKIDFREVQEARDQAAECHASQIGGGSPRSGILGKLFQLARATTRDSFMRAYPEANSNRVERDLFAGVR